MSNLGINAPKGESNSLRSTSLDEKKRAQVANALELASKFLQVYRRSGDYFSGMSLADIVADRLAQIGTPSDTPQLGSASADTALNRLEQFSNMVLEATKAARTIDAAALLDNASESEE